MSKGNFRESVNYWLPRFRDHGCVGVQWRLPFSYLGEGPRGAREIAHAMLVACDIGDTIREIGVDADKEAKR